MILCQKKQTTKQKKENDTHFQIYIVINWITTAPSWGILYKNRNVYNILEVVLHHSTYPTRSVYIAMDIRLLDVYCTSLSL